MFLLISSEHIYFIWPLNALHAAFLLASRIQSIGIEHHWIIPGFFSYPAPEFPERSPHSTLRAQLNPCTLLYMRGVRANLDLRHYLDLTGIG